MAGTLFHGKGLHKRPYTGRDNREHYEIEPIEGDLDVVSISNWIELMAISAREGVPADAWPDYDDAFDIPLDEVESQNRKLRQLIVNVPESCLAQHYWLRKVANYLRLNQLIAYARN